MLVCIEWAPKVIFTMATAVFQLKHQHEASPVTLAALSTEELMFLNCGVEEDSGESLGLQGDQTSPS